jgi:hypothetical protein
MQREKSRKKAKKKYKENPFSDVKRILIDLRYRGS